MGDVAARAEIDSLMAWWHSAGVDTGIAEEPHVWLTPKPEAQAASARRAPKIDAAEPPPAQPAPSLPGFADLGAFHTWLATDTAFLAPFPVRRRIVPAPVAADLMIVADVPEAGDVETGQLLSGEVGALLDRMLSAIGRDRSSAYLATMAPARPPIGRIDDAAEALLAPVMQAHVRLAAPKRLWLMGNAVSRAVLGMDTLAAAGRLHCVNHDGVTMVAIATVHPSVLLGEAKSGSKERPRRKATWAAMQMLMEGGSV